jgi:hypothetical protein
MIIERRRFIRGALSLIAAPAIVRVSSIMPVKAIYYDTEEILDLEDLIYCINPPPSPFLKYGCGLLGGDYD